MRLKKSKEKEIKLQGPQIKGLIEITEQIKTNMKEAVWETVKDVCSLCEDAIGLTCIWKDNAGGCGLAYLLHEVMQFNDHDFEEDLR